MASSLADHQPTDQCHLLRLANESLHQVCRELFDDKPALSNLRLTCRALQMIPEQYLFTTVQLDRRSSSLVNLQAISRHPRLRHHITDIRLEIEERLPELRREQWQERVGAFPRIPWGERPIAGDYIEDYKLLAQERDSMTASEREEAYGNYLATWAEQKDLEEAYTPALLADIFATSLPLLPQLCRLNHGIYNPSLPRGERYGISLGSAARKTLTAAVWPDEWSCSERNFINSYTTTFMSCLFQSGAAVRYINMGIISWEVLAELRDIWQTHKPLPALVDLSTLVLSPWMPEDTESFEEADGFNAVAALAMAAPNLTDFEYTCGPIIFGDSTVPMWGMEIPPMLHTQRTWHLRRLALAGLETTLDELRKILHRTSRSLRHLRLEEMDMMNGGHWVDLWEDIRRDSALDAFELRGRLYEVTADRYWWVNPEATRGDLLRRVQEYMTHVSDAKPWKTSTEIQSPEDPVENNDHSMSYFPGLMERD